MCSGVRSQRQTLITCLIIPRPEINARTYRDTSTKEVEWVLRTDTALWSPLPHEFTLGNCGELDAFENDSGTWHIDIQAFGKNVKYCRDL